MLGEPLTEDVCDVMTQQVDAGDMQWSWNSARDK